MSHPNCSYIRLTHVHPILLCGVCTSSFLNIIFDRIACILSAWLERLLTSHVRKRNKYTYKVLHNIIIYYNVHYHTIHYYDYYECTCLSNIIIVFTVCLDVHAPPSCRSSCRRAPIWDDEVPCSLGDRSVDREPSSCPCALININAHTRCSHCLYI